MVFKKIWLENNNFAQLFVFLAVIFKIEKKIEKVFLELKNKQKPVFPVDGNDMLSLGISSNKIGDELAYIQRQLIEKDFMLTKQDLIDMTY